MRAPLRGKGVKRLQSTCVYVRTLDGFTSRTQSYYITRKRKYTCASLFITAYSMVLACEQGRGSFFRQACCTYIQNQALITLYVFLDLIGGM